MPLIDTASRWLDRALALVRAGPMALLARCLASPRAGPHASPPMVSVRLMPSRQVDKLTCGLARIASLASSPPSALVAPPRGFPVKTNQWPRLASQSSLDRLIASDRTSVRNDWLSHSEPPYVAIRYHIRFSI